jgi:hypothetical protein
MAFTEVERASLRSYLGFSDLYRSWSRLEVAITAAQSISDGGAQLTSAVEESIRTTLAKLITIDSAITDMTELSFVKEAEGTKINSARAVFMQKIEGERLIKNIATALGMKALVRSYFFGEETGETIDSVWGD